MGKNILKPISCSKCGKTMRWQVSELECIVHCDPCRRAILVSDWDSNAKLFGKQPGND